MTRPYHPSDGGADLGREPMREEIIKAGQTLSQRIDKLLAEMPQGRQCPKCGFAMVHYRLYGYRCPRMCES